MSGQDPRRHQTENGYGCGEEAEQVDREHLDPRSARLNRPKTVARLLFVILTGLDVVTGCATEKKQSAKRHYRYLIPLPVTEAEIARQTGVTELRVRRAAAKFTRLANLDPV